MLSHYRTPTAVFLSVCILCVYVCVFVCMDFFVECLTLRFVNVEVDTPAVSTLWTVDRSRTAYARLFYTVVSYFLTAVFWQQLGD